MKFNELCRIFENHNERLGIKTQYGDKQKLYGYVVFSQRNFKTPYTKKQRTYSFTSDNKFFISNMCGSSIYASCSEDGDTIRLDKYLGVWEIEDCYIY